MKKIYSYFLIFLISFCIKAQSQVYVLNVKNIQNFEHPFMKTNDAIKENKIKYIDAGTTDSKHVFDLTQMTLYRNAGGILGNFEIVRKYNDESIFNVMVKFTNGQIANFIYQKESTGLYTLYCRWVEKDKITGWFDSTLK